VSTQDNRLLIDRIIPKQKVILSVYLNSTTPISSVSKPYIKSDDANGKAYQGRGNVPPSMGPAVMGLSIASAAFITFMYIMLSGSNIFYPYYSLRYSSFMDQGFTPSGFSDNYLISHAGITSKPPIIISKPYIDNSRIVLPLKIKNITKSKIKITILHNLDNESYRSEIDKSDRETLDLSQSVDARNKIDEKYGYSTKDKLFISGLILAPEEEKTIQLAHTILPATTVENFDFYISIEKGAYEDQDFRDHYEFNIQDFSELSKVQELLESLQH
jgi:hypothetical protein